MKTSIINPFARLGVASTPGWLLPALIAVLSLLPAGRVTAQTFTTLHSFTEIEVIDNGNFTFTAFNPDGANPYAGLILSGNTLYGTAYLGGSSGNGAGFAVNTDGTGFTNLHSFAGYPTDGADPQAGLILSGNTLYGTASQGGISGQGTVFAVNTDGTGFTNLHSFAGYPTDGGSYLSAGLTLS